jgi:hypothetical protein
MIHLFMKKTKLEILAKLLQDKVITVEEFITLSETTKEYIYYPYSTPQTIQPYRYEPIYCGTTTAGYPEGTTISNTTNAKSYEI